MHYEYSTSRLSGNCVIAQAISHYLLTSEALTQPLCSSCGICGEQSTTGTGFYLSTSVFPCQLTFHTDAPYSFSIIRDIRGRSSTEK
jgi:hypothetical protein